MLHPVSRKADGDRQAFLLADSNAALKQQVVEGRRVQTAPGNGVNPHKLNGGHLYDWAGTVFIEGATLERTLRFLQDYDHRPQYFPEVIATSKLLCRTGHGQFRFTMRMKEPSLIDVENDVVWQKVDAPLEVPFLFHANQERGQGPALHPAPLYLLAAVRDR